MQLTFHYQGESTTLSPRKLEGEERLGQPRQLNLELFADQAVPLGELLGKACVLTIGSDAGVRQLHGVVREASAMATGMASPQRRYRVVMESSSSQLGLRKRCRVFQNMTAGEIVQQIADEGGLGSVSDELTESHPTRRYVTQYHETDWQFVRRLCEEDGLWLREDPGEEASGYVLADRPMAAPEDEAVQLADEAGLVAGHDGEGRRAWQARLSRRRAPGKVVTRDYAFSTPAVTIEGEHQAGTKHEQGCVIYAAPDRAPDAAAAGERSRLHMEALRAQASEVTFDTSALTLRPGVRVTLETQGAYSSLAPIAGEHFVVAVTHLWEHGEPYRASVIATPIDVPYRLPRQTPRPHIAGLQYAVVTGPPGEEIFVDDSGCIRVRFFWDRYGPTDQGSSLPVRVLQTNLQGSMLVPRIGWEVWVAFEDGDPDRPYVVVLRAPSTGKHRPPVSLPENKTMTSLSTSSSPGGGCQNFVQYDDAAGRQSLNLHAGFGMTKHVAANSSTQTVADEKVVVNGSQTVTVGGDQTESVKVARALDVDAQTITVSGSQTLKTPQAMNEQVTTDTLVVGAALLEAVGSPGDVAGDVAVAVGAAVGGMLPFGAAQFASSVAGPIWSSYKGYKKDGNFDAAAEELSKYIISKSGPAGEIAGPVIDVIDGHRKAEGKGGLLGTERKKIEKQPGRQQDGSVGGTGAAGGAGPADSGSGNRIHDVGGTTLEIIGAASIVATPTTSKLTTLGASAVMASGPHITATAKASWMTAGASVHVTGLYKVAAGELVRTTRQLAINIGAYSSDASSHNVVHGKSSVTLNCGALTATGDVLIMVGGSAVVIDGSTITINSPKVDMSGASNAAKLVRG